MEWFKTISMKDNTKQPIVKGWGKGADPLVIASLDKQCRKKNGNYGILCGPRSGILVIDYDLDKVPHLMGEMTVEYFKEYYGNTLIVQTRGGGFHVYLKYESRFDDWVGVCGINGFIDIRTHGNYVVGPGSSIDGKKYTVVNYAEPGIMPRDIFNEFDNVAHRSAYDIKNKHSEIQDVFKYSSLLEENGFTNVSWISGYGFTCDQRGPGSRCPLCKNSHENNHFYVCNPSKGIISVKNQSDRCKFTCLEKTKEAEDRENQSDFAAASAFLAWCVPNHIQIVSVSGTIIWYNPDTGLWCNKFTRIKPFFNRCEVIGDTFRGMDKHQNAMMNQIIPLVKEDNDWYMGYRPAGYMPLSNGVWDFVNKTLVQYRPAFKFFSKLDIEWKAGIDTRLVRDRLFEGLFEEGSIDYIMTIIARALAGHLDKAFLILIGDGNSGKGLFESAFKTMLGSYFGTINGGSLTSKDSGGDSGKLLSWMVKIKDCKLAFCQEVNMDKPLNGVTLKKLISGGDGIQARTNFTDEIDFILQCLVIIAANDLPRIDGVDDAFRNRIAFIEMKCVYLEPDQVAMYTGDKIARPIDASIKEIWSKEKSTAEALFALLAEAYSTTKPTRPPAIIKASNEWTEADNTTEKIKGLFIPGGPEDYILPAALVKAAEKNGIRVSPNKLGRIMKSLNYKSDLKPVENKSTRAYWGIRLYVYDY